jgi:thiamine-phosphate diphosphorylase/hydroxyethylthiazole kinase
MFEVAAERAAAKEYVRGPGSFVAALLDELYALRRLTKQSPETNWVMDVAKLREVTEI